MSVTQRHRIDPLRIILRLRVLAVLVPLAGCTGSAPPAARPVIPASGLPFTAAFDSTTTLTGRICAPEGPGPWPIALLNHGSAASPAARPDMQPMTCQAPPVRWFTAHGYLTIMPLRRGFGASGGAVAEDTCLCAEADFAASAEAGADDIAASLAAARHLPWVRPDNALVVGQSTGGWAALAYAGRNDPGVRAVIAFAPGRGAKVYPPPHSVYRPDLLEAAAAQLGARSRLPVLWIAALNDSYFPPEVTAGLHRAYTGAGGQAVLAMVNPFFDEGHALYSAPGGADLWGPLIENFLQHMQESAVVLQ